MFVAGAGLGAEDEVVADLLGGRVEVLDQVRVEGAVDVDHDAEQPGAPAGQQAGGAVHLVTELGGGFQDALPGALAGAGHTTQHQGDGRGGHAHAGGHVLQPGRLLAPSLRLAEASSSTRTSRQISSGNTLDTFTKRADSTRT